MALEKLMQRVDKLEKEVAALKKGQNLQVVQMGAKRDLGLEEMQEEQERLQERVTDTGPEVEAAELGEPIQGYDMMLAANVIDEIKGMDAETRQRVRDYEVANKNRRQIISALDSAKK
jgi:hypothetical protein